MYRRKYLNMEHRRKFQENAARKDIATSRGDSLEEEDVRFHTLLERQTHRGG